MDINELIEIETKRLEKEAERIAKKTARDRKLKDGGILKDFLNILVKLFGRKFNKLFNGKVEFNDPPRQHYRKIPTLVFSLKIKTDRIAWIQIPGIDGFAYSDIIIATPDNKQIGSIQIRHFDHRKNRKAYAANRSRLIRWLIESFKIHDNRKEQACESRN